MRDNMSFKQHRYKVGDLITNGNITRKITKVLSVGYIWIYPDYPNKEFDTNNSNDVNLEWWVIKL